MNLFEIIFGMKKRENERLEKNQVSKSNAISNTEKTDNTKQSVRNYQQHKNASRERHNEVLVNSYDSPKYKEDRYSDMVRNALFNPYNVTLDPVFNRELKFTNMVSVFKNELESTISMATNYGMPVNRVISGYIINMLEDYYKSAGLIPKAIVDSIVEQIFEVLKQTKYASYVSSIDQLKYETYYNLTNR